MKRSFLFLVIASVVVSLTGLAYVVLNYSSSNFVQPKSEFQSAGVSCGGWDTYGEVVCGCSGEFEEFKCPQDAICDSGRDVCYGTCGECKCYRGSAQGGVEIPCEGRESNFMTDY